MKNVTDSVLAADLALGTKRSATGTLFLVLKLQAVATLVSTELNV